METDQEKQCAAAAKEGGRIFCSTFLSLLPRLLLLLLARISTARHQTPAPNIYEQHYTIVSIFLHTKTTLILSLLVFAAAIAAVIQGFAGDKRAWLISNRRRLHGAVVWLSSMQICLSLWIHGVVEGDDRIGSERFGNFVFLRSLVLALGLHGTVVLWRRKVVKPVVDEAVFGFSDKGFNGWVEEMVVAAAVGCLWWWRLRREAEELVVVRKDVDMVDVVGWLVYCLTAAVGGVRVVKSLLWVVNRIFRWHPPVNGQVGALNKSSGLKLEVEM